MVNKVTYFRRFQRGRPPLPPPPRFRPWSRSTNGNFFQVAFIYNFRIHVSFCKRFHRFCLSKEILSQQRIRHYDLRARFHRYCDSNCGPDLFCFTRANCWSSAASWRNVAGASTIRRRQKVRAGPAPSMSETTKLKLVPWKFWSILFLFVSCRFSALCDSSTYAVGSVWLPTVVKQWFWTKWRFWRRRYILSNVLHSLFSYLLLMLVNHRGICGATHWIR